LEQDQPKYKMQKKDKPVIREINGVEEDESEQSEDNQ
jgi:hypothetical protein